MAEQLQLADEQWRLVYQSRSGRPQDPWLEPDICDYIEELHADGVRKLVVSPIGFLSDHMEVMYDLDDEALKKCQELGVAMSRAATPRHTPAVCRDDSQADSGTDGAGHARVHGAVSCQS